MTVVEPTVGNGTSYFLLNRGVCLCITVYCLHSLVFSVDIPLLDFLLLSSQPEEAFSPREFVLNFPLMIDRFLLGSRPMSSLFIWNNFSIQLLGKFLFQRKHYSNIERCFVTLAIISFDVIKRCSYPLCIKIVRES